MATSMFADDSRGTGGRMITEMNITPLVDVMLVLLIIFMVAAPIATRSLDLTLPSNRRRGLKPSSHRICAWACRVAGSSRWKARR